MKKFLIAFSLVLLLWLLLHNSSKPIGNTYQVSLLKSQQESNELVEVLRRASMPDRTIILTIVEEAWTGSGSVLDLFLESFRVGQGTKGLLNHLLIATVGKGAFEYCKSVHPHCFKLAPLRLSKPAAGKQVLGHGREGIDLLHRVIQLGYNLIFTEADVMWFRNPVTEFDSQKEVTIPCDVDSENAGDEQDRGIFFLKSDVISLEFFGYLNLVGILYPSIPLGSPWTIASLNQA